MHRRKTIQKPRSNFRRPKTQSPISTGNQQPLNLEKWLYPATHGSKNNQISEKAKDLMRNCLRLAGRYIENIRIALTLRLKGFLNSVVSLLFWVSQKTTDNSPTLNSRITMRENTASVQLAALPMRNCRWSNTNRPLIYPLNKQTKINQRNRRRCLHKLLLKTLTLLRIFWY